MTCVGVMSSNTMEPSPDVILLLLLFLTSPPVFSPPSLLCFWLFNFTFLLPVLPLPLALTASVGVISSNLVNPVFLIPLSFTPSLYCWGGGLVYMHINCYRLMELLGMKLLCHVLLCIAHLCIDEYGGWVVCVWNDSVSFVVYACVDVYVRVC